uniref:Secreted protein n=1 Tax=Haemonchus placei TaxID=6290 RepID=A0A0N4WV27_HAEPC
LSISEKCSRSSARRFSSSAILSVATLSCCCNIAFRSRRSRTSEMSSFKRSLFLTASQDTLSLNRS